MWNPVWIALALAAAPPAAAPPAHFPATPFVAPPAATAHAGLPAPAVHAACTGEALTVRSNGIPGFAVEPVTPAPLAPQEHRFRLPLHPKLPAVHRPLPLLGPVGVTVTGLPLFGPNLAEEPEDEAFGDAIANGHVDACLGNTGPEGDYHFHGLVSSCLAKEAKAGQPSPLLGYAFDGFPIYGPAGCADAACTRVVEFSSGWERTGDPRTDVWSAYRYTEKPGPTTLDRCNGRLGPDGTYRYHATATFPYVLGCFAGRDVVRQPAR
jgi:hypothetical protein